jgi:hypothetical protein
MAIPEFQWCQVCDPAICLQFAGLQRPFEGRRVQKKVPARGGHRSLRVSPFEDWRETF